MSTRREFLAAAGGAAGFAMLPESLRAEAGAGAKARTILFQGDSITDGGRDKSKQDRVNDSSALGNGYPFLVAAALLEREPARGLRFFNRGISGNKVPDLDARWAADTIALQPDILSILVGVNDIWHKLGGRYGGTVEDYRTGYAALLARTKRELPAVRIVVLEPFVLRTGAVTDRWFPEFDERRAAAAEVARAARVTFVPLQAMFDRLSRKAPPAYWAADGVHPTPAGHEAIARAWMQKVKV